MSMISADECSAIVDTFGRLLTDFHGEPELRKAMASDEGYDKRLWREMGALGLTALLIDPAYGGIGGGAVELGLLMEEAGAYLLCSPFIASSVIAASFVSHSSDENAKQRLLPLIAAGSIATVAITGDAGLWTAESVEVLAEEVDGKTTLSGTASYVLHSTNSEILLVLATGENGVGLYEVNPLDDGIDNSRLAVNDPTLCVGRITFDEVQANEIFGFGAAELNESMDIARIALAAESAGGARKIFDITIDYIANRYQFGRPIGGFQALKHMAADLLIEVENSKSVARNAAEAYADDTTGAAAAISLASFYSTDSFFEVAAKAIQMHGGIAFTMEYVAHLYWRRSRTNLHLFGTSDFYREQYLQALEESV